MTPPSDMTIDPSIGLINRTPTAGQVGDNTIQVQVEDQCGLSAAQTYTVSVN